MPLLVPFLKQMKEPQDLLGKILLDDEKVLPERLALLKKDSVIDLDRVVFKSQLPRNYVIAK